MLGAVLALLCFGPRSSSAAPAEPVPVAGTASADVAETPEDSVSGAAPAEALRTRVAHIRALVAGTLDAQVDAEALLRLDLADPDAMGVGGEQLRAILAAAGADPSPSAEVEPESEPPAADTPPVVAPPVELSPSEDFVDAYVTFLQLPAEQRASLLEAHAKKRAALQAATDDAQRKRESLDRATKQADALEAFLAGELDTEVDPRSLLLLDLGAAGELAGSKERRQAWLANDETDGGEGTSKDAGVGEPAAAEGGDAPAPEETELDRAHARIDSSRRTFLALTFEEQAALFDVQDVRVEAARKALEEPEVLTDTEKEEAETAQVISDAVTEAEEAAAAKEAALLAAREATTEANRILAEERARLLGIKEQQALYEADINRRKAERNDNHDKALEWSRRVGELAASTMFASEKADAADPMYEGIRGDLSMMRDRLRSELVRIRAAGDGVPSVGEGLDRDLPSDVSRDDLLALRAELSENEAVLTELEQTVGWELAQGLRDDVVLLNKTRLGLLEIASGSLRASVTGFGQQGIDQVKRELDQISVELGFHALKIPRYRRQFGTTVQGSAIPVLIGLVQFILIAAAYVWWRRRGGELLTTVLGYLEGSGAAPWQRGAGTFVWYLQRVRRPLELLLALWVLFALVGGVDDLPEFQLLWIIALWVLLGLAVILFVDALAARETLYSAASEDNSDLRIRSLRLVGLNVIAVGLILSLTSAMVGKGAIYSWVLSTCWILSFPVALYLVHQWRPIIFQRIELRVEQNPFTRWVTARREGLASFPAAAAAAVFLLAAGFGAWVMRQLSGLEATRRLLAYMFRREVAKQAAATEADGRYTHIDEAVYAQFNPQSVPEHLLAEVTDAEVQRVVGLAVSSRPTLTAVIGERGAGKSTFLRRVASDVGGDRVIVLSCPEEGWEALQAELAALCEEPELRGAELCAALRGLGSRVIAIDDLQRLVVPAVNGLRGLDAFTSFARDVGGEISWVVGIGSASWHYIRRARGESVFFEQIVHIPKWTEDHLGGLIRDKCERAGIKPSFDGLVVPRQSAAPLDNQGDRTEAGYYRLLWDFSRGNPAVALHAFRESLFVNAEGGVVVRLFKEPSPEEIEDLSMPVLFVLRAVVQLELAMASEVEAATQLPGPDIADAIRFCSTRGYLEPFRGGVRLTWPWYRTITTVLTRQHLLPAL